MAARQKFLIASIVLFVTSAAWSLPWKLVGAVAGNPLFLIFVVAGFTAPTFSFFGPGVVLTGALALFVSWGMAAAEKGGPALILGAVAVAAALGLIIHAAGGPSASGLSGGVLLGYLLWLASPVAACFAGLACVPRVSNRG